MLGLKPAFTSGTTLVTFGDRSSGRIHYKEERSAARGKKAAKKMGGMFPPLNAALFMSSYRDMSSDVSSSSDEGEGDSDDDTASESSWEDDNASTSPGSSDAASDDDEYEAEGVAAVAGIGLCSSNVSYGSAHDTDGVGARGRRLSAAQMGGSGHPQTAPGACAEVDEEDLIETPCVMTTELCGGVFDLWH